ncbi:hypothetical protein [Pedobacter gandavensis]|nr:hypothetical protein [Pedobacter gandavensis]
MKDVLNQLKKLLDEFIRPHYKELGIVDLSQLDALSLHLTNDLLALS